MILNFATIPNLYLSRMERRPVHNKLCWLCKNAHSLMILNMYTRLLSISWFFFFFWNPKSKQNMNVAPVLCDNQNHYNKSGDHRYHRLEPNISAIILLSTFSIYHMHMQRAKFKQTRPVVWLLILPYIMWIRVCA